jgi:hypothetical protein
MGQTLERLSGRPYEDVAPAEETRAEDSSGFGNAVRVQQCEQQQDVAKEEEKQIAVSFECVVCKEYKPGFVVGCPNGHGACTTCMPRLKATSNRCPLCRVKLIQKPISVVAPMGIATASAESPESPPNQEAPPYPGHKRVRADSPGQSRRVRQLVQLAEQLVEGPLPALRDGSRHQR